MRTSRAHPPDGIRQARRAANWMAAFLVAITGGAAAALAHGASHSPVSQGTGTATSGKLTSGPNVSHSVATTTGSGVTVVTTTRTANGKTIVTRVRTGRFHGDD